MTLVGLFFNCAFGVRFLISGHLHIRDSNALSVLN